MKSIPILSRAARRLAALGALAATAVAVTAAPASAATIPAGGMAVEHASLDWTGSLLTQSLFSGNFHNYFSAGVSNGKEATYKGSEGNASVILEKEAGAVATWASRENFGPAAGEHQVVRLLEGTGRIEADGSAKIAWTATFSVNFYGGLAPFTIENPVLTVNPGGSGEVTATLRGCSSSQANPNVCTPFESDPGAQVAAFSGASIDPEVALTVNPLYAGVAIVPPAGAKAQNTTEEGWGSWPQSFVDFHGKTGLASFWYSSGSASDAEKAPLPIVVDFKGPKPTPPAPAPSSPPQSTPSPAPAAPTTPAPGPAKLAVSKGVQRFGANGVAKVASLACPSGGATCTTTVPKRLGAKIAGKRFVLGVMAPKKIGAGKSATVRVRVPKAAQEALDEKSYQVKLPVALHANGATTKQVVKVKIAGRQ